jgi:hypothetical protein
MKILAVLGWVFFMMVGLTIFSPVLEVYFLPGLILAYIVFPAITVGIFALVFHWIHKVLIQK